MKGDKTQPGLFQVQVHMGERVDRQAVVLAELTEGPPVELKLQGGWRVLWLLILDGYQAIGWCDTI